MNPLTRSPSPPPAQAWTELLDHTRRLASLGWPVVPTTYPVGRHWYGRPDATRLTPVQPNWHRQATTDPHLVNEIWSERPYGTAIVLGTVSIVLDVPPTIGGPLAHHLGTRGVLGPIVVIPSGGWQFHLIPGDIPSQIRAHPDIRIHDAGGWTPAPPTETVAGRRATWRHRPQGTADLTPTPTEPLVHALMSQLGL